MDAWYQSSKSKAIIKNIIAGAHLLANSQRPFEDHHDAPDGKNKSAAHFLKRVTVQQD